VGFASRGLLQQRYDRFSSVPSELHINPTFVSRRYVTISDDTASVNTKTIEAEVGTGQQAQL
jgi:hypothetical protein